jgi:hypothetical protein
MEKKITIYHGSEKIIENPIFGGGKRNNDFGFGFHCTESEELAKEWAVSSLRDGFSNRYTLNIEYLNILNCNTLFKICSISLSPTVYQYIGINFPDSKEEAKEYLLCFVAEMNLKNNYLNCSIGDSRRILFEEI